MNKLSSEWLRLAGLYERACNAVRQADWDSLVSDETYAALIDARENAFAALRLQGDKDRQRQVSP